MKMEDEDKVLEEKLKAMGDKQSIEEIKSKIEPFFGKQDWLVVYHISGGGQPRVESGVAISIENKWLKLDGGQNIYGNFVPIRSGDDDKGGAIVARIDRAIDRHSKEIQATYLNADAWDLYKECVVREERKRRLGFHFNE